MYMCRQRQEGGGVGPQSPEKEEPDDWMATCIRKEVDPVLQHHHTRTLTQMVTDLDVSVKTRKL